MRSRCGGGCCSRSKRRSAKPIQRRSGGCSRSSSSAAARPASSSAGALAEIARQSLRQDFRRIRPESARIILLEGSPHVLATFPGLAARAARARRSTRLGVEVRTSSIVVGIDEDGVTWRPADAPKDAPAQRISAQTVLWAAGVAASPIATSLGVPLDRAGRVTPSRR